MKEHCILFPIRNARAHTHTHTRAHTHTHTHTHTQEIHVVSLRIST